MQTGFAAIEVGTVSKASTKNILLKVIILETNLIFRMLSTVVSALFYGGQ